MSMLANVLDTRQAPRNDRELVASCLSGDEQAWSELIDRYNRLIFSIPLKQGLTPVSYTHLTLPTILRV